MTAAAGPPRAQTLVQALCLIVLAIIAGAAGYAVWIWIANYSRIGI